jgi:hypothetical protein
MKYDLLLAELVVEKSQNRKEVSQRIENQESKKRLVRAFLYFFNAERH